MDEPWMEDLRREAKWDAWLQSRPVCIECRQPITDEEYLPTENGPVCPGCVKWRMVPVCTVS